MPGLKAKGPSGEVRTAGRLVARLGAWSLESESGAYTVDATLRVFSAYLLDAGKSFDVTLDYAPPSTRHMRARHASVMLSGDDRAIITGRGRPEVI